jgi:hypothetical protein
MKYLLIFFSSFLIAQENELKFTLNNAINSEYLVVFFPGFGYTHQQTDEKTPLNEYLFSNHISTLIIDFYYDLFLEDDDFQNIRELIFKYGKDKKIIIGGFSIGGNIAMNFHEFEKKEKKSIKYKRYFFD